MRDRPHEPMTAPEQPPPIDNPALQREPDLLPRAGVWRDRVTDLLLDRLAARDLKDASFRRSGQLHSLEDLTAAAQVLRILAKPGWDRADLQLLEAYWPAATRAEVFADELEEARHRIQGYLHAAGQQLAKLQDGEADGGSPLRPRARRAKTNGMGRSDNESADGDVGACVVLGRAGGDARAGSADALGACRAGIRALREALGHEPEGAALEIRECRPGGRPWYEIVCHYDRDLPGSAEYAFRCRRQALALWAAGTVRLPLGDGGPGPAR